MKKIGAVLRICASPEAAAGRCSREETESQVFMVLWPPETAMRARALRWPNALDAP